MSLRDDEWQDWPASDGPADEDVMEGIWWAAMAFSIGLLIFRLMQVSGIEIYI